MTPHATTGFWTAGAKPNVEYKAKSVMDAVEDGGNVPAQSLVVGQHDQTQTAGYEAVIIDASPAQARKMPLPSRHPLHHIGYGFSLPEDSGIKMSAAEMTDIEETNGEQRLTDALLSPHSNPNILENAQALLVHTLQPDFIAAGQLHTEVLQPPSHQEVEGDIEELQHELNYDADSAYDGDSIQDDDTETLASFITNYRWENGRRYHAYSDGAYWGANDEVANEVQDLAHHLYKLTLDNKLHLVPIKNSHTILDIGTGTGIWAIEIADLYPSAHVIGTDLSPIQPTFVPPNCHFEIEDANMEWTFPHNHFDFIHVRELFGSVSDWDRFFKQSLAALKPGGYLEILEHSVKAVSDDDTVGPESFYTLWGDTVIEMGERRGKSFSIWKESRDRMEKMGFEDLVEVRYKWPMNGWSKDPKLKELGMWNQLRLYDGIEGMMLRVLTHDARWSYQRAQVFMTQQRKILKDYTVHAYLDVSAVYGRKPALK